MYSGPPRDDQVRRLDFYKLSREKQERFLASTKGTAPPAPLVKTAGDGGRALRWAGASAAALVALLVVYSLRYGALGASLAVQGAGWLAVYAALVFAIPYAALRAVGSWRAGKILPYKPGVYVFPMCLVDARDKVLGVFAMTDLANVSKAAARGTLRLSFRGGGAFAFPAGDAQDAELINRSVDNAREQVKHALATSDDSELVTLDPFYDAKRGWTSPIGPKQPLRDGAPAWRKFDWAIAAACALVIGPSLWFVRNKRSDDSMLAKATAKATPEAFETYLTVGKRHSDEVSKVLLPRAELDRAKSQQTVEAVQAFIAAHPNSAIDAEAQGALREALLRELDKAKKASSLAALAAFEKKYPDNHLAREVAAARHDLYAAAVARFKTMAARNDPDLAAFVARLAKQLETRGPAVAIVFHREVSPALAQADKLMAHLSTNRAFGRNQVSRHFDEKPDPKEAVVAAVVQQSLLRLFSPDLIDVKMSPPLDDAAQAALAAKEPVIAVRYRFGWLGVAYSNYTLKRAFAGVHVGGEALFSLPDGGAPLKIKIEVRPAHGLPLEYKPKHEGLEAPPASETDPDPGVYHAEDMRALDHIASILERSIVAPPKER
jgi:hypothetical protein